MMKLSKVIDEANSIYDLRMSGQQKRELHRRLISAGHRAEPKPSGMSRLIDDVLKTADSLRDKPKLATATTNMYSGMKVETAGGRDGCPRCKQPMRRVALLSDRQAEYCQGCAITLPTRA